MQALRQQSPAPSTVDNGDPVYLKAGGCAIVDQRLAPLLRIMNGHVVKTKDGAHRRISWNLYLGWVEL